MMTLEYGIKPASSQKQENLQPKLLKKAPKIECNKN